MTGAPLTGGGATQLRLTRPSPGVATRDDGGPGALAASRCHCVGRRGLRTLVPALFVAVTVNVYAVLLVSPGTTIGAAVPEALMAAWV